MLLPYQRQMQIKKAITLEITKQIADFLEKEKFSKEVSSI